MNPEDLIFNGAMGTTTTEINGRTYFDEMTIGVTQGSVVIDFLDMAPNLADYDDVGVYIHTFGGSGEKLDLRPEDSQKVRMLAGSLLNNTVTIGAQVTQTGQTIDRVRAPFDMNVVDVNHDGAFTVQDVLHAVADGMRNSAQTR